MRRKTWADAECWGGRKGIKASSSFLLVHCINLLKRKKGPALGTVGEGDFSILNLETSPMKSLDWRGKRNSLSDMRCMPGLPATTPFVLPSVSAEHATLPETQQIEAHAGVRCIKSYVS